MTKHKNEKFQPVRYTDTVVPWRPHSTDPEMIQVRCAFCAGRHEHWASPAAPLGHHLRLRRLPPCEASSPAPRAYVALNVSVTARPVVEREEKTAQPGMLPRGSAAA